MRATVGIVEDDQATHIIILRGRGHAGNGLPWLRRQVCDRDRCWFIEGIILRGRLGVRGQRAAVEAAVAQHIAHARRLLVGRRILAIGGRIFVCIERVGIGSLHVQVGIDAGCNLIGVGIAVDRTQAVDYARHIAKSIGSSQRAAQGIHGRAGATGGSASIICRPVGIKPGAAARHHKG